MIVPYFQTYGARVLFCIVLQLGAMICLGIFVATVISRMQFLGARAAGVYIALLGGFLVVADATAIGIGYICGAVGLVLSIYLCATRMPRTWWAIAALALLIALGLTAYAGAVVRPRVDAIRTVTEEANPNPARRAEFDRLHRLSVMLNGGVMLLNLGALLASAVALTPHG